MNFQLEFFYYCIHDSVLTIFLGIVMALTIDAIWRNGPRGINDRPTWLKDFQQDVLKAFTMPIWSPMESNPLPPKIEITPEQRKVLDDLAKPIYKLFRRHCKDKAKE